MPFKITFTYLLNTYGFSESWYDNTGSNLQQVVGKASTYLAARLLWTGSNCVASFVRISALTNPRQVFVINPATVPAFINTGGFRGYPQADAVDTGRGTSDVDSALLCRCGNTASGRYKFIYLRGIPDAIIVNWNNLILLPPFLTPFNAWIALMTQGAGALGWSWAGQQETPVYTSRITSMAPQVPPAPPTLQITLANLIFVNPVAGPNLTVKLSKCQGAKNINGTWPVTVTGAGTCTMNRVIPIVGFLPGTGTLTVKVPSYFQVNSIAIQRAVERKAGRPLYQSRGRQPIRKYV